VGLGYDILQPLTFRGRHCPDAEPSEVPDPLVTDDGHGMGGKRRAEVWKAAVYGSEANLVF